MGQLNSAQVSETHPGASSASSAKNRWWLWIVVIVVLALGYLYFRGSRTASQAAGGASGASTARGGSGAGSFVVPVVVATAQKGDLPVIFNGLGSVTAFNTVAVRSRVDGQLVTVAFQEGQFVHQGDVLAQIDPRPFQVQLEQAQGQLAKDMAQRKDAQVNLERFKLLFDEGVIPQQQLDTQAALVGQVDGSITADQSAIDNAKLQLTYSRITAPISGRVGLRLVDAGNIVHATDPNGLVVITQLQPIAVIFSLPQDQLPVINSKLHAGAHLPVEAYDRDNTARVASGKLLTIDNQIDSTTGTYKLKAVFDNSDNALFPNQFVNVHLLVDTARNLTVVPTVAIQRGPQGTYVYAVDAGNKVTIRTVTVGQDAGNSVGVSAGLNPGEVVVIDGQDKLQEGSAVNPTQAPDTNRKNSASAGGTPNSSPAQSPPPAKASSGGKRK